MSTDNTYHGDAGGGQDARYHGWTNWHTWAANLYLTNQQPTYQQAMECRDEFAVNALFEETFAAPATQTGYIDGIDPDQVNWAEIFQGLHEGE